MAGVASLKKLFANQPPRHALLGPRAAFEVFDADHSGAVSVEEIKKAVGLSNDVLTMSKKKPTPQEEAIDEEAKAILAKFDTNKSGELEFEQFTVLWGQMIGGETPSEEKPVEDVTSKRFVLFTEAELDEAAKAERIAFKGMDKRAAAATSSTFLRRLGQALMKNEVAAKAQKGNKDALTALLRTWDLNGDGGLSKMELRSAVRGPGLALKSESNADIDALFNSFDEDGTDELDLSELKPFLQMLQSEATAAAAESESIRVMGEACKASMQALEAAAAAMKEVEALERQRKEFWGDRHVGLRLMATMDAKKVKIKEVISKWKERDAKGFVDKKCFTGGVMAFEMEGVTEGQVGAGRESATWKRATWKRARDDIEECL